MKVRGIVLAGGLSRRFGEDKALAKVNGITLIEHAVSLLRALKLEPVVITNVSRDYSFLNCDIERDLIPGKGPLGGLYTAFVLFPNTSLLTLTCDMPALQSSLLKALLDRHSKESTVTVFRVREEKRQPFPGVYESNLLDLLHMHLDKGDLSLQDFLKAVPNLTEVFSPRQIDMFRNVNEKADLQMWLK